MRAGDDSDTESWAKKKTTLLSDVTKKKVCLTLQLL